MYTIIGGTLATDIDFSIKGELPVSDDKVFANAAHARTLGLKTYRSWQTDKTRLAVVGGGPSIKDNIETLRNWNGDIWAINGAWKWCRDNGIEATFFACDPHEITTQWAEGASKALLEISCDPSVFELLKSGDVYTFDADIEQGGIAGCASTASCAPHMAARMGYRSVTFFGCESSYTLKGSHAYMDEARKEQMLVRCGDDYLTAPDLYLQAIGLAGYIKQLPEFLNEQSGGLLRAMITEPSFRVTWLSQGLVDAWRGKAPGDPKVSSSFKGVSGAFSMADNAEAFAA